MEGLEELIDLTEEEKEIESSRTLCQSCERPNQVCWCSYLPNPKVELKKSRILILQHPNEAKRRIRTALMAELGISRSQCKILKGRKFKADLKVFEEESFEQVLSRDSTFVLYPGEDAVNVVTIPNLEDLKTPLTFVILDGTWDEAKKIFNWNPLLKTARKASLSIQSKSEYVVRTQPADFCLSTLETAAHTLAIVENDSGIVQELLQPLHAMCNFQVNHGAVTHDSKEFKQQNRNFVKKNDFKKKKSLKNA